MIEVCVYDGIYTCIYFCFKILAYPMWFVFKILCYMRIENDAGESQQK